MTERASTQAVGDTGCWVRWIPLMWRAIADPDGGYEFPPAPEPLGVGERATLEYRAGWWAPLLQWSMFAMGWPHPEVGIAAATQSEDEDPRLDLFRNWWAPQADQILGWFQRSEAVPNYLNAVADRVSPNHEPLTVMLDQRWSTVRETPAYLAVWGGGSDAMHLGHALAPVQGVPQQALRVDAEGGAATLMLDEYAGWYAALSDAGRRLGPHPSGRSWRVDVVVRPLGWLGTYRQSRDSGRWFSGRHRHHQLGII